MSRTEESRRQTAMARHGLFATFSTSVQNNPQAGISVIIITIRTPELTRTFTCLATFFPPRDAALTGPGTSASQAVCQRTRCHGIIIQKIANRPASCAQQKKTWYYARSCAKQTTWMALAACRWRRKKLPSTEQSARSIYRTRRLFGRQKKDAEAASPCTYTCMLFDEEGIIFFLLSLCFLSSQSTKLHFRCSHRYVFHFWTSWNNPRKTFSPRIWTGEKLPKMTVGLNSIAPFLVTFAEECSRTFSWKILKTNSRIYFEDFSARSDTEK